MPSLVSVRPLTAPTWAAPELQTHCLAAKSQARTSPSAPPDTHCTKTPRRGTASAVSASEWPSSAQTKGLAIIRSNFAATTARWYSLAAAKGWCFGSKFLRANLGSAPLISRFALRAMTLTFMGLLQAALLLFWLTAARTGPAIDAQRWQPTYAVTTASDVASGAALPLGKVSPAAKPPSMNFCRSVVE